MTPIIVSPPTGAPADIAVLWTSADLLARCKRHARRPAADASMLDADWYAFLTEAQAPVYQELFTRFPDLGFAPPKPMVTDDNGVTYNFGLDLSNEDVYPSGFAEIYPSLAAIPDDPLIMGEDFLYEEGRIRMLYRARIFPDGPYSRLVLMPDIPISASYEPLLRPKPARMLLVWKALSSYASRPGTGLDQMGYEQRYGDLLQTTFLQYATAYNRAAGSGGKWWTQLDLGASGLRV